MPLYRCRFPLGDIAPISLAAAGRQLATSASAQRSRAFGIIEAAAQTTAQQHARAWCHARSGEVDALIRRGLRFRREGRFHVLYRLAGPLFDPADWTLVAHGHPITLDQARAAKETFITAHLKDARSPYETLVASQLRTLDHNHDPYDAAVWDIALRDALAAAREFGDVPATATLLPLAHAAGAAHEPLVSIAPTLTVAHSAD